MSPPGPYRYSRGVTWSHATGYRLPSAVGLLVLGPFDEYLAGADGVADTDRDV